MIDPVYVTAFLRLAQQLLILRALFESLFYDLFGIFPAHILHIVYGDLTHRIEIEAVFRHRLYTLRAPAISVLRGFRLFPTSCLWYND